MKIHFFTKRDEWCGSSRQRAFAIADRLNEKGVEADVHVPSAALISETKWPKKATLIWKSLIGLKDVKKDDIMYLQRPLGNKYLVVMLVLHKLIFRRKWYFDLDDAVFVYQPHKTKFFVRMSDVIIVGNHALQDWAKQYNPNAHIVVTSVDSDKYKECTRNYSVKNDKLTIGWVGGANHHYENLKMLVPVFEQLIAEGVQFRFVLIGAQGNPKTHALFNDIKGMDARIIDQVDWTSPKAVPSILQTFDVGVMPLVEHETTRYKCAFKAIEYMACGVVPVISPVGENNYLVQEGVNGFLADSTRDWVDKIKYIYAHPEQSAVIGKKAQETIEQGYSFEAVVNKLIELFKTA